MIRSSKSLVTCTAALLTEVNRACDKRARRPGPVSREGEDPTKSEAVDGAPTVLGSWIKLRIWYRARRAIS